MGATDNLTSTILVEVDPASTTARLNGITVDETARMQMIMTSTRRVFIKAGNEKKNLNNFQENSKYFCASNENLY
jgi:hypothetical protein